MPVPPQPCPGGNQPPAHTYTRSVPSAGGTRTVVAANCGRDFHRHYDLSLLPNGNVEPHGR